ncbi:MAG: phenylalanine--tRNA ligase subunit alpha [Sphingobacteriia bacterium]|jgi:phenylalanyl-tRNA synthetase alpha chain|nr:phenylalanine--tRNA ligase subunit alpha [Sphingobacteriia bacterium]
MASEEFSWDKAMEAVRREAAGFDLSGEAGAEAYRLKFLSKKGEVTALFEAFRALSGPEKKAVGQALNALRQEVETRWKEASAGRSTGPGPGGDPSSQGPSEGPDLATLPPPVWGRGSRHPLALTRHLMLDFFGKLGFRWSDGPELVDDWHNFEALHFGADHPARDMQDTFFVSLDPAYLLRTHTSSVQVKEMMKGQLPLRTVSPGRVYRNETVSARSHMQFHQVEGLYIDQDVSFADLKKVLYDFATFLFGPSVQIRFRPSYFPFTEPSAEMDVTCFLCSGTGCGVCKHSGWVEILGCGMVDPQVLENCGIDPDVYSGYAFGIGIERLTMLRHRIPDIRLFYENDLRFVRQFGHAG